MPILIADDGARIHYTVTGTGEKDVIFLHNLGGNVTTWSPLFPLLNLEKLRCIAIDFRGTGKSEELPCELTNERLVRDVLQVADAEGVKAFTVVGHSMGAKLALFMAATEAARVDAIAVLGCLSPQVVPIPREVIAEYLSHENRRQYAESVVRDWFWVWPRPEIDAWIESLANMPDWAMLASCELSLWKDFSHIMRPFPVPVYALVGKHDAMYGPNYFDSSVRPYLPDARVEVIECGHGFMLERPEPVASCLNSFLLSPARETMKLESGSAPKT